MGAKNYTIFFITNPKKLQSQLANFVLGEPGDDKQYDDEHVEFDSKYGIHFFISKKFLTFQLRD